MRLAGRSEAFGVGLQVYIAKVAELEDEEADMAAAEQPALAKGDLTQGPSVDTPEARKLLSRGGQAVGTYTLLRQIDACDVQFTRQARLYRNGYQVVIVLQQKSVAQLESANANYFATNADCNNDKAWSKPEQFIQDLIAGKTDSATQAWSATFDQITASLTFK